MNDDKRMRTRIMDIECKALGLNGSARIGCVTSSKSGRSLRCQNKRFQSLNGRG